MKIHERIKISNLEMDIKIINGSIDILNEIKKEKEDKIKELISE